MKICKDLGFITYEDPEGYYGYAEIGEGSETFGIIGHLEIQFLLKTLMNGITNHIKG